jgi:hypothetical protein
MARLFNRKRDEEPPPRPSAPEPEAVPLDGDEHAWWAQQEVSQAWKPRARKDQPGGEAVADAEPRDILAEHFGEDWRTSFEFSGPSEEDLEEERRREQQAIDDQDSYKVLGVEPTASWDEIVEAHRSMARAYHPDRLFGRSEEQRAEGEERIRVINTAYQELRVRRGK